MDEWWCFQEVIYFLWHFEQVSCDRKLLLVLIKLTGNLMKIFNVSNLWIVLKWLLKITQIIEQVSHSRCNISSALYHLKKFLLLRAVSLKIIWSANWSRYIEREQCILNLYYTFYPFNFQVIVRSGEKYNLWINSLH